MSLNEKTNKLIDMEIGEDDGAIYPGQIEWYNTVG
jgi:hypothetical protein